MSGVDDALHGLDAARRAGWAKYYAEAETSSALRETIAALESGSGGVCPHLRHGVKVDGIMVVSEPVEDNDEGPRTVELATGRTVDGSFGMLSAHADERGVLHVWLTGNYEVHPVDGS